MPYCTLLREMKLKLSGFHSRGISAKDMNRFYTFENYFSQINFSLVSKLPQNLSNAIGKLKQHLTLILASLSLIFNAYIFYLILKVYQISQLLTSHVIYILTLHRCHQNKVDLEGETLSGIGAASRHLRLGWWGRSCWGMQQSRTKVCAGGTGPHLPVYGLTRMIRTSF